MMKIKKMYNPESLPDFYVIETLDGKFFRFNVTPFRKITEKGRFTRPFYISHTAPRGHLRQICVSYPSSDRADLHCRRQARPYP